jgi:glucose-1-phosphate adenylyltransferase
MKILSMILAGGKGKRMDLLCYNRPKPVLPFAGAFKVIDFVLSNCVHSNIASTAVLVDYQKDYLVDYLRGWEQSNSKSMSFHLLDPKSGSYKGTADAVYQNMDFVKKTNPDALLVLAGDHVYRMDYSKMAAFHKDKGAGVTIGSVTVPLEEAHRFGIIVPDEEGKIISFEEKPLKPAGNLISMGIYMFDWKTLQRYLEDDSRQSDSSHDFGYSIIPQMVKDKLAYTYNFNGYWQDIGTVDSYYEANMELISVLPMLGMNDKWPILSKDFSLLPPQVINNENVKYSLISPGCIIKGNVENSILGPGVRVNEHSRIKNSIVYSNASIGRFTIIDHCIIDEDVNIKEFCYIGFGAAKASRNPGITVLGKGAEIPQGTAIGYGSKVSPDVQPVDFWTKTLPARSVVLRV